MTTNYNFDVSDAATHKFAVTLLLSRYEAECILMQDNYAYRVKGGTDGHHTTKEEKLMSGS